MKGIADTALGYKGKTRRELGLKCEETCAEFVSKVLAECGYPQSSVSCNELFGQMKADQVRWSEPEDWMKKDDVIFFEWDGTMKDAKPLDHVGVVCSVDEVNVYYVNINGNDHDRVTVQSMKKNSKYIAYWLRPLVVNSPEKQDSSEIDQIVVRFKDGSEKVYREHFG